MAAPQDHLHLARFDHLQNELNSMFDQTGRMFAAINRNPEVTPIVHAARLDKTIGSAGRAFTDTMYTFEREIRDAHRIMRRDLALYRARNGLPGAREIQAQPFSVSVDNVDRVSPAASAEIKQSPGDNAKESSIDGDVTMEDAQPEPPVQPDDMQLDASSIKKSATTSPSEAKTVPSPPADPTESAKLDTTSTKPTPAALQIATTPSASASNLPATDPTSSVPNTADTTTDLDSLFGGPRSATDNLAADFSFADPQAEAPEFDFDAFGTEFGAETSADRVDGENIATLLPGLEDYANTQSAEAAGGAGAGNLAAFDEFMDLGEFEGEDAAGVSARSGEDLDFDALFN